MELFGEARAVRLRSHTDRFLSANDDARSVGLSSDGRSRNAVWEVVRLSTSAVKLRSWAGAFAWASETPFILGVGSGGRKVVQRAPAENDDDQAAEWVPLKEGFRVRLMSRQSGGFLRCYTWRRPWRSFVTHDHVAGNVAALRERFLWEVEPAEMEMPSPLFGVFTSLASISSGEGEDESSDLLMRTMRAPNDRIIFYTVIEDEGDEEDCKRWSSLTFQGNDPQKLSERLEETTELSNIIVCGTNSFRGKIYPLHLPLPPGNLPIRVILVKTSPDCRTMFDCPSSSCLDSVDWQNIAEQQNEDLIKGHKLTFEEILFANKSERPQLLSVES